MAMTIGSNSNSNIIIVMTNIDKYQCVNDIGNKYYWRNIMIMVMMVLLMIMQ